MLCRNTKTGHIYDYNENLRGQMDIEILSQLEEKELRDKIKEEKETVTEEVKPKKGRKAKEE